MNELEKYKLDATVSIIESTLFPVSSFFKRALMDRLKPRPAIEEEMIRQNAAVEINKQQISLELIKQKVELEKTKQLVEIEKLKLRVDVEKSRQHVGVDREKIKIELQKEEMRQTETTRRLVILVSAALFILAILVIVFCPAEKQSISNWLGGSVILLAAGAAGYKEIFAKNDLFQVRANSRS